MLTASLRSHGAGPGVLPLPRADDGRGEGREGSWRRSRRLDAREYCGRARRPQYRKFGPRYDGPMRTGLLVAGVVMTLAGLVWLAQGLNLPFAPRSFMTADRSWAFIGAVTAVAGVVLVVWARGAR
jgi:hypothetical protein